MEQSGITSVERSRVDEVVIRHFAMREQELLSERGQLVTVIADLAWDNYWLRQECDRLFRERASEKRREQRRAERLAA
jgi:hypothetical protein